MPDTFTFYRIPPELDTEIGDLEQLIEKNSRGEVPDAELKAHRVPFGVYEQRKLGTYMVRVRCPGGALAPWQLKRVAELSTSYGGDSLHVTTRQEIQIHDVELDGVIPLIRELRASGLASRGGGGNTVRNIMASWDSGIAPDEVFDVFPYAAALTNRLIAENDSWLLPRKYKISFSNSPGDNAYATLNDLGFIAALRDGKPGFKVYVAGGMGRKPSVGKLLHDFIPADEVYLVAEAIKKLFAKHGNRRNKHAARLRFLWNSLGESRFRELYEEERAALQEHNPAPLALPGFPNRAGESIPLTPITPPHDRRYELWRSRYVREQKQTGLLSVHIPLFLGKIANDRAVALAEFLSAFGSNVIRGTMNQNLALRNIPSAYLGNVYDIVTKTTELAHQPALMGNAVACAGASTCQLGICLPRGALEGVRRYLEKGTVDLDALGDIKLNLSGCSNTCGQHVAADLGFFGKVARRGQRMYPAYNVVAGAVIADGETRLARRVGEICARDLPRFVADCAAKYREAAQTYPTFGDYVRNGGAEQLGELCQRYDDIPDFEDDKNYYFDWGSEELFSLAGRGIGECSAGLFDLIEVDLDSARKAGEELAAGEGYEPDPQVLYRLVVSTARALLITRGVEARSDREIFERFTTLFIDTGLIDARFKALVAAASSGKEGLTPRMAGDATALLGAVEQLYATMDNSLRFAAELSPKQTPAGDGGPAPGPEAAAIKDFRGVGCPMNYVKTKLALAGMQAGEALEVLLDDGEPIENVPRSAAADGHTVEAKQQKDNHWSVLIRKG